MINSRLILFALTVSIFVLFSFHAAWAEEGIRTFDGKHAADRIQVRVVYFVPQDRQPLPDWEQRVDYFCRRLEKFHQREFAGQSKLFLQREKEPLISARTCEQLRSGDQDFIFFQTVREAEARLGLPNHEEGAFPIILVLSEINWRELDDFTRLRADTGKFEGNYTGGRHFPGAESGGARATYSPQQGAGWGLVSADGWRVPYTGSDCVVYHEGLGHTVGLPHPQPGNGSVMSLAQYRSWLGGSWLDDDQKKQMNWRPQEVKRDDLFSTFSAIPAPLVPRPGQEVQLELVWPQEAVVKSIRASIQTDLLGPWQELKTVWEKPRPAVISLGSFDRPTPVSYRLEVELEDGQTEELWGYFQVRTAPGEIPPPRPELTKEREGSPPLTARWEEAVDLLALVDHKKHAVQGTWMRQEGILTSEKMYGARIEIPYSPPEEYVLTAIVEPLDRPNGLILGQKSGEQRFLTLFNYQSSAQLPLSALENIDGKNVGNNVTTFAGQLLKQGQASALKVIVRKEGVTAECDGRTIFEWQGKPQQLSLSDYWKTPNQAALFLGSYDCRYRFHRVSLVPITGTGKKLTD